MAAGQHDPEETYSQWLCRRWVRLEIARKSDLCQPARGLMRVESRHSVTRSSGRLLHTTEPVEVVSIRTVAGIVDSEDYVGAGARRRG